MKDKKDNTVQTANMTKVLVMVTGATLAMLATLCFVMPDQIAETLSMDKKTVLIMGGVFILVGLTDMFVGKFIIGKRDTK